MDDQKNNDLPGGHTYSLYRSTTRHGHVATVKQVEADYESILLDSDKLWNWNQVELHRVATKEPQHVLWTAHPTDLTLFRLRVNCVYRNTNRSGPMPAAFILPGFGTKATLTSPSSFNCSAEIHNSVVLRGKNPKLTPAYVSPWR